MGIRTTEFFDKEYTARQAYGRLFQYAKKYKVRLLIGLLAGFTTAMSWMPLFQVIQPVLKHVQTTEAKEAVEQEQTDTAAPAAEEAETKKTGFKVSLKDMVKREKSAGRLERKDLPGWFNKADSMARKFGLELLDEQGNMTGELLVVAIVVVPFVMLVWLGSMYLNQYCLRWSGAHVVQDLRQDLFNHLQQQSLQFFGRTDVGQIMSRCTNDPQQIEHVISRTVADLCRAPFEILVAGGFVIYFAIQHDMIPTLVLMGIGFPLVFLPITVLGTIVHRWARRAMQRVSIISSKMHENITCIRVVKAYNTEALEEKKYQTANRDYVKTLLRSVRIELLIQPVVEALGVCMIFIFIIYCFFTKVAIYDIVPLVAPLLVAYRPMRQLSKVQAQVERGRAALCRIFSLMDLDMSLPIDANPIHKTDFTTSVKFDHVSFRYGQNPDLTIKDVSFEMPRGKIIAVVGGTGSGKTTLANLLARFYDPTDGSITMDDVPLHRFDIADLRKLIGVVTQETVLFNDTIANNIAYGTEGATREQIIEAAKMANAHEFIIAQPEGYDRIVGEKGFALSGGERQRVAIARAILKNPPILVLDEATSALDTVTERLVQDAINRLMANRTTFAIAHRLSTIRNADQILVMANGVIQERGTHDELYAKGGVYRRLCEMQQMD
ncbi:MAG: ABC transporter ATP-binding protein [Kiritimatiellae bacterium]|nr:ABC transporter ATP-binding protein [Kiritimatiellia bacterium]